jgi:hypothetical protein
MIWELINQTIFVSCLSFKNKFSGYEEFYFALH